MQFSLCILTFLIVGKDQKVCQVLWIKYEKMHFNDCFAAFFPKLHSYIFEGKWDYDEKKKLDKILCSFVVYSYKIFAILQVKTRHCCSLRKCVLFFVRIQVQYRKSVKNVTFLSTNHDLFLKKVHFFQIKNIFDSKKRTSLAPIRYWTTGPEFVLFSCFCFKSVQIKRFA
jgi:hypothetical protein